MVVCAWCGSTISTRDTGELDSHGICHQCKDATIDIGGIRCRRCRFYSPDSKIRCIQQYLITELDNYNFVPIPDCRYFLPRIQGNYGYNYYTPRRKK